MFRVITVTREFGSGGGKISRAVAERLRWNLLDSNLLDAIAGVAQVDVETARRYDETIDSWWHRMHWGGVASAALAAGAPPIDCQFFDAEAVAGIAQRIIADAAVKGACVIVGRGAQCVLQDCPDALHVFIYGPWSERVARVQVRVGSNKNVEELVRSTDRVRAAYIRKYFGYDWKDPHLYHMMLSSQLGVESIVRLIVDVVEDAELGAMLRSYTVEGAS